MDPLRKLTSADRVGPGVGPFNAQWFNKTVDSIKRSEAQPGALSPKALVEPVSGEIWIAHVGWDDVGQFGVTGIEDWTIDPDLDEEGWRSQTNFYSADPETGGLFAITLDPIRAALHYACIQNNTGKRPPNAVYWELVDDPTGYTDHGAYVDGAAYVVDDLVAVAFMGRAVMTGVTKCKILVDDETHGFAYPASGNYTHLLSTSNPTAPAKIIRKQSGVGEKFAVIEMCQCELSPDFNTWRQACQFYPAGNITGDASSNLDINGQVTGKSIVTHACHDVIHAMPLVVPHALAIDQIAVWCETTDAGGNCRVAIYDCEGPDSIYPRTLLAESNELPTDTAGWLIWNGELTLQGRSLYWLCVVCDSATAKFGATSDVFMKPIFGMNLDSFETLYALKLEFAYDNFPATFPATIDSDPNGLANGNFVVPVVRIAGDCDAGSGSGEFGEPDNPTITESTESLCSDATTLVITGTFDGVVAVTLTDAGDDDVANTIVSDDATTIVLTLTAPPIGTLGALTAMVEDANGLSSEVQVATVIDCTTLIWQDTFTDTNGTALEDHTPDIGGAYTGTSLEIQGNRLSVAAISITAFATFDPPSASAKASIKFIWHPELQLTLSPRGGNDNNIQVDVQGDSPTSLDVGDGVDSEGDTFTLTEGNEYTLEVENTATRIIARVVGESTDVELVSAIAWGDTTWELIVFLDGGATTDASLNDLEVTAWA